MDTAQTDQEKRDDVMLLNHERKIFPRLHFMPDDEFQEFVPQLDVERFIDLDVMLESATSQQIKEFQYDLQARYELFTDCISESPAVTAQFAVRMFDGTIRSFESLPEDYSPSRRK